MWSCSRKIVGAYGELQGSMGTPMRARGTICGIYWKALHTQAKMLWVVLGDFNEIVHLDEKLGWRDKDAKQMKVFRETLSGCELIDLGLVGKRYTWWNGRFRDQHTLVRLDRMVANESWRERFPKVMVHHVSMAASDHCLLAHALKRSRP